MVIIGNLIMIDNYILKYNLVLHKRLVKVTKQILG